MLKTIQIILAVGLLAGAGYFGYKYFMEKSQYVGVNPNTPVSMRYENTAQGIAFSYDSKYELQERTEGDVLTLVLLERGYTPPVNGEGPPTISIQIVPSDMAKLTLDEWLPGVAAKGISVRKDMLLATTTAAHREAYLFRTDGLYAGYATAIKAGARVYVFNATYISIEDEILNDYAKLLTTVEVQ